MITLEYDNKYEVVLIVDKEGAEDLQKMLLTFINDMESHYHLMTPAFGGDQLSDSLLNKNNSIVNMLRIQYIK